MLVFLRTGTALALMPVFGYQAVPMQVKAALAFILSVVLTPTVAGFAGSGSSGLATLVGAAAAEVLAGAVIGLAAVLVLAAAEFAGVLLGIQIGFGMATVIDPQFGEQTSIIGQMQYLLALVIFLALDFHHHLLLALAQSFKVIPLGGAGFSGDLALGYARLSADVFVVAVKLAAPVLAMLVLTEIALAFMARMMPQMNVWFVGFPAKIGVGLFGLALAGPMFLAVMSKFFRAGDAALLRLIDLMGR